MSASTGWRTGTNIIAAAVVVAAAAAAAGVFLLSFNSFALCCSFYC